MDDDRLGTQTDLRITDDGSSIDINWDTRWQACTIDVWNLHIAYAWLLCAY
ncbi:MAG: hypothetical protein KAV45_11525 [Calditrichia bacterium]|nr:hypothetical protein [Calditrichia bacterium]